MTYNEKRHLYESIMKDVAIIVKRQINEIALNEVYGSNLGKTIKNKIISISKANPNHRIIIDLNHMPYSYISYCSNGMFSEPGGTGAIRLISQLTDDCFDGNIIYNSNIDVESLPKYFSKANKKKCDDLIQKYRFDYNRNKTLQNQIRERFQYITVWIDHENLDNPICVLFAQLKNYEKIDEIAKNISKKVWNRHEQKFNNEWTEKQNQKKREETLQMLKQKNKNKKANDITLPDINESIKPDSASIKDGYVIDYYTDEDDTIKIKYGIKSISEKDSMFFYCAFIKATVDDLSNDFFIDVGENKRLYKDWMHKCDSDTDIAIDAVARDIYNACFKNTTDPIMLARKMKQNSPKFGFEFIYKII